MGDTAVALDEGTDRGALDEASSSDLDDRKLALRTDLPQGRAADSEESLRLGDRDQWLDLRNRSVVFVWVHRTEYRRHPRFVSFAHETAHAPIFVRMEIWSTSRTAKELGVSPSTVRFLARRGVLPAIRYIDGGHFRFSREDVLAFREQSRTRPREAAAA